MRNIEKRDYIVYAHINKVNRKIYIGKTNRSLKYRSGANGKGYKNCSTFYKAIEKYGWENFEHIVLIDKLTKEESEIFEGELIKKYRSINPQFGYNTQPGVNKKVNEVKCNRYGGNDYLDYHWVSNIVTINVKSDIAYDFEKRCLEEGVKTNVILEAFMKQLF